MTTPLDIHRLPHQPPMRWIQSAARVTPDEIVAEAKLPANCGGNGNAPVLLGLEILAQAAGLLLAHSSNAAGISSEGRLLQVKTALWHRETLPLTTLLKAGVTRLESSAIGLHQFSGTVSLPSGEAALEAEFCLLMTSPAE